MIMGLMHMGMHSLNAMYFKSHWICQTHKRKCMQMYAFFHLREKNILWYWVKEMLIFVLSINSSKMQYTQNSDLEK